MSYAGDIMVLSGVDIGRAQSNKILLAMTGSPLWIWLSGLGGLIALGGGVSLLDVDQDLGEALAWFSVFPLGFAALSLSVRAVSRAQSRMFYKPGKTFRFFRQSDGAIKRWYRWAIAGGLAGAALGVVLICLGVHGVMPQLVSGGLALTVMGYVGGLKKIAHADVDPVAVDMLKQAGLIGSEKVYCAFRNFEDAGSGAKKNNIILGVLADRIVLIFNEAGKWSAIKRRFAELNGIGFQSDQNGATYIGLQFRDGVRFIFSVSDSEHLTTEPITFARQLLASIDDHLDGGPSKPKSQRKRIVTPPTSGADPDLAYPGGRVLELGAVTAPSTSLPAPTRILELAI